jgi:TRAP-type C4-dicarboxylate transport system permease small subunit
MAATSEKTSETQPQRGPFGWLRAVDDGVFAVEQAIVVLALIGITIMMFVNVLARRIQAPDSKVGALVANALGVTDLVERAALDANVAPWVTLAASFAMIVFGYYTWQRFVRKRKKLGPPPLGKTLSAGAISALVLVAAGWGFAFVFDRLESKLVFAGLFGAAALGFVGWVLRTRPPAFAIKAVAGLAGGAGVVWFCIAWFPIGYTWTNKVSLMLLLWVGMLGASVCVHEGKHIRMEGLGKLAPAEWHRYITAAGFLVAALFSGLMTWLGVLYTFGPNGAYELEGAIEGTDIPDWVGTFSVVVGFGLATLRFLGASVSWLLGGEYGTPAPDEGMEEAKALASAKSEASS